MVDQEKIKLMTKLAINDKYYTKEDKKITNYYPEDYIYLCNFKSRILIMILVVGGVIAHLLWRVNKGLNMPTTLQEIISKYIIPYGLILVVCLIIYTIISTIVAKKRYKQAVLRMEKYQKLVQELEIHEKEQEEKYGAKRKRASRQTKDHPVLQEL